VHGRGDEELARAVELLRASDPATAAEAELQWGESIWQRGDQQSSFAHFERATETVAELPASQQKLFVVSQVARFLTLAGRAREGFDLVDDAIRMAEELGDVELLADSLNTRGVARVMLGDARWIEDAERSLELALEATSWRAGRAYINLGSTLLWEAGEIARAERVMREGLGFAEGSAPVSLPAGRAATSSSRSSTSAAGTRRWRSPTRRSRTPSPTTCSRTVVGIEH
jgi:tetratricopeptide (TPR) repeat protein